MRDQADTASQMAGITVSAMARMLGLSRSRFYELMQAGVFLPPVYRTRNKRAFYPEQLQRRNLEIRRTGRGFNGRWHLFNMTRNTSGQNEASPAQPEQADSAPPQLVEILQRHLRSLGLCDFKAGDVEEVIASVCPEATAATLSGEQVRDCYRTLAGDSPIKA